MHALPLLVAHVLGVQRVAADAGGADEDVEARQSGRPRRRAGVGVADVVAVRQVEDMDVGAARAEALDGRGADPARAAGDERDTACEVRSGWSWCISIRSRTWPSTRTATTRSVPSVPISSGHPAALRSSELTLLDDERRGRRAARDARRRCACRPRSPRPRAATQLAENLRRAAELAPLPDDTILEIYTALRPARSSAAELEAWARAARGAGTRR